MSSTRPRPSSPSPAFVIHRDKQPIFVGANAVIPFPSLAPQELTVSIRDAKFDYTLEIPAAQ